MEASNANDYVTMEATAEGMVDNLAVLQRLWPLDSKPFQILDFLSNAFHTWELVPVHARCGIMLVMLMVSRIAMQ
eukprot:1993781-Amphidinium_carterae.1